MHAHIPRILANTDVPRHRARLLRDREPSLEVGCYCALVEVSEVGRHGFYADGGDAGTEGEVDARVTWLVDECQL